MIDVALHHPWVFEAYSMYMQGISYPNISDYLGIHPASLRYQIKRYATQNKLTYPRLHIDSASRLAYNLHVNGMRVIDIATYLGVCKSSAQYYIRKFAERYGVVLNERGQRRSAAYHLREKGHTYQEIADMLGYENRSNSYRAVKEHKKLAGV
jgi:uncharacterized protein YjcR